jgi:hypothetical protein
MAGGAASHAGLVAHRSTVNAGAEFDVVHDGFPPRWRLFVDSDRGVRRAAVPGRHGLHLAAASDGATTAIRESIARPDNLGVLNPIPEMVDSAVVTRLVLRRAVVVAHVSRPGEVDGPPVRSDVPAQFLGRLRADLVTSSNIAEDLLTSVADLGGFSWRSRQAPPFFVYLLFGRGAALLDVFDIVWSRPASTDPELRDTLTRLGVFATMLRRP